MTTLMNPTATKLCGTCGQHKTIENFAYKSKARGTRQSRCRVCQSAYNRAHHAANKKTVNPRIHARTRSHKANLIAEADTVRHTEACPSCGRDRAAGADIVLLPPAALTGNRPLSAVIASGWSLERFQALLTTTVADPAGVRCRRCLGRELGLSRDAATSAAT